MSPTKPILGLQLVSPAANLGPHSLGKANGARRCALCLAIPPAAYFGACRCQTDDFRSRCPSYIWRVPVLNGRF